MIDDPLIDLKKEYKRKLIVYVAAFSASILVTVLLTAGLAIFSNG